MNIHGIGAGSEDLKNMIISAVGKRFGIGAMNIDEQDVRELLNGAVNVFVLSASAPEVSGATDAAVKIIAEGGENLHSANRLLIFIEASKDADLGLDTVDKIANRLHDAVQPDATIIVGAYFDADINDAVKVTVFAAN